MRDREAFRQSIEEYLKRGRKNWGLFADELGYKREHVSRILHGKVKMPEGFAHHAVLALAQLECLRGKDQARHLLQLLDIPDFSLADWKEHPLVALEETASNASPVGMPLSAGMPALWNIPYPRNAFFTGRELLLQQLAETWKRDQSTAPQALSGLSGIGKTHIAVEYAHLHRQEYQAVLWVHAETREELISGYLTLAELLNLPEKYAATPHLVIEAVKTWLQTQRSWLLILDHIDDIDMVDEFVPPVCGGHLLITTQLQATGTRTRCIEIDPLPQDVGALFLLHRARVVPLGVDLRNIDASDLVAAREICTASGGLPLALDQAGAFIEELQCSLQDYQERYRTHQGLLLQRRGKTASDHPEPVATTWSLPLEKVKQRSPLATDLLQMCALLHPDAIPMELVAQVATNLGSHHAAALEDALALDEAIATLGAYSLIHRNAKEKTLSIHRLVQVVLRDSMDKPTRRLWAERTVQTVNRVFPEVSFPTWPLCERYLPHAFACVELIEHEQFTGREAARLLYQAGCYLLERARAFEAYPLLEQALIMSEQQYGLEHAETASMVDRLAQCLRLQGKYVEAEPLYQQALAIREKLLGADHPDIATSLNNGALLSTMLGKYEQAELLYRRALSIRGQALGPEHPDTAQSLNDLASLYWKQGKYQQAELLFQRALSIREQALGPEHPDTAQSVWWLASLSKKPLREYEKARLLYQRALSIYERTLGSEHPQTQKVRRGYVSLLRIMERSEEM
jgi:tetratricopeptide (TPR) repeat protein